MATNIAFFSADNPDDKRVADACESAGFRLLRIESLAALAPASLLVADARALTEGLAQQGETGTLASCEIIALGSAEEQEELAGWLEAGRAIFLSRPVDTDHLLNLLRDVHHETDAPAPADAPEVALDQFGLLYGSSEPMRELYLLLRKAAASDAVLLVCGESGTGKELVARSVHAYSERSGEPFEAINCGAIPSELVESELFGHEKGSFSGASRAHKGVFERAGRGTLLLDEITEMDLGMQVKLLRVLETGRFRRVGGEKNLRFRARIVAATNRKPRDAVHFKRLREDLYYRISQMEIHLPPLRERGDDIVDLAHLFVNRYAEETGQAVVLGPAAESALRRYGWPGNVRQLHNVIRKACAVARGTIGPSDLPPLPGAESEKTANVVSVPVGASLAEAERRLLLATLDHFDGDKQQTADTLGISLRTLYSRLKEYRG